MPTQKPNVNSLVAASSRMANAMEMKMQAARPSSSSKLWSAVLPFVIGMVGIRQSALGWAAAAMTIASENVGLQSDARHA